MGNDDRHPSSLGEELAKKKAPKADWWRHPYLNFFWLIVAIAFVVALSIQVYKHPDLLLHYSRRY